jgi:amino acid transporter
MALPALIPFLKAQPGNEAIATTADAIAKSGWGLFSNLFNAVIMPSFIGKLMAIGIIIANFLCALAALTSTSRMIYAFARDDGLPASGMLKAVSPTYRTPVNAIWATAVLTFLLVVITTPLGAFAALSTGCAMYLYVSYAMPIIAGLISEGKSWTTYGSFRLGGLSKLFGLIVLIGTVLIIIAGHAFVPSIPATDTTSFVPGLWYYSVGYGVLLAVIWFALENRRFKGPPVGEEIKKRQSAIAAAEKALGAR